MPSSLAVAALGLDDGLELDISFLEESLEDSPRLGVSFFGAASGDLFLFGVLFSVAGLLLSLAALVGVLGLFLSSPLFALGLEEAFDDVATTSCERYLSLFLLEVWTSLALSGTFSALSLWRVLSRLYFGCLDEVLGLDSLLGIGESDLDLTFRSSSLLDLPLLDGGEL